MKNMKIFFLLLSGFTALIAGFSIFISGPKEEEIDVLDANLTATIAKFNGAQRATEDLENIRKRVDTNKENLEKIKNKFITKNQLSDVTVKMKKFTNSFNLRLVEFTPVFESYFADSSKAGVKDLPFSLVVRGEYLDIGRFVESWDELDFYVVPEEFGLFNDKPSSTTIEAVISGRLFEWTNTDEDYGKN